MERLGAAENPADIQLDARATDRLKGGRFKLDTSDI
jgi:hypothetical protein